MASHYQTPAADVECGDRGLIARDGQRQALTHHLAGDADGGRC